MAIHHCPYCGEPIKPGDQVCSKTGKLLPFVTDTLSPGTILQDKYEIQKLLHSGGMGYVYLAIDKKLQRQCIVKQVKERVKSDAHLKKLEAEALHMAQLSHPNVAMVLDHFVEDNYYYLVVEYIEGKTLSQIYEERGILGESEVVEWTIDICDVVSYVHRKGIVHRDISPDNIMLTEEGFIKLVDFGTLRELREIAAGKATKEGKFGFTPPEQWQGKPVKQSDIFAIGATIYYLLTGYLPLSEGYRGGGKPEPEDYNPEFPPIRAKNPGITAELENILSKALSLNLDNRYYSVDDLEEALESYEEEEEPVGSSGNQYGLPGGKPVLGLDRISINFGFVIPGARSSKHFIVQNIGTGALMGKIAATELWLEVSPAIIDFAGNEKDFLVTIDASHLPLNFHGTGYIAIQTNGGNARIEVKVNTKLKKKSRRGWIVAGSVLGSIAAIILMVGVCPSPPPPVLDVNTSTIYFNNLKPGLLEADSQSLTISNTGGQKLTGTLTTDKNWLRVSPTEIEVGNGANQDIRILADTRGLKYKLNDNCFVTIKTNGGETQIPVYLTTTSVLFEDDFNDPNSGWPEEPSKYGNAKYENGGYRITANNEEYVTVSTNQYIGVLDDFMFEVDATPTPQTSGYTHICVVFRTLDSDNYYQFRIISNIDPVINYTPFSLTPKPGVYTFGKNVAGQFTTLQDWTESSAINTAVPVVNRLKIVCQGANISLYCNGTLLQTFTDYSLKEGEIQLGTGVEKKYSTSSSASVGDVLFDNLKISIP